MNETSTTEKRGYTLDPGHVRGLEERVHHDRRPDGGADPPHVPLVRDLCARLLLGALRLNGDTIMQGSQDIAVHVGTLHTTCKSIIEAFEGDMHEGDVFAMNDPYLGGTHFNDVRIVRPIFHDGEVIAYALSNGHWADVGGSVPGSFDITAKEHFGEGLRITPVRIYDRGRYLGDVVRMIVSNTRAPSDAEGDLHSQVEATRVAEREILRLVPSTAERHVMTAFAEVQDYVERLTRQRIERLPDGTWQTEDYIDSDPFAGEGLVPVKVKLTIEGDQVHYDLTGSHPVIGTFLNSCYGTTFSGVVAGTKTFFPDIPLNSGFYRAIQIDLGPPGTVVNAEWPVAVTGFCAGPYEKIMNSIFELWSRTDTRAGDRLLLQPRIPARRGSRHAPPRVGRSSCGTTGWSAAGAGATARTARTRPRRSSAWDSPFNRSKGRSGSHPSSRPGIRSSRTRAGREGSAEAAASRREPR